jgi:hypothetical protein
MRKARVAVAARILLADQPGRRAVEYRPPCFELEHPLGRLFGQQANHAPVAERGAAAHRVAEMGLPRVFAVHVAQRRRDPSLGHHRVRLAQQRLAQERRARAVRGGLDRRAQACAPGADHQHVAVVDRNVGVAQNSLGSRKRPIASSRT